MFIDLVRLTNAGPHRFFEQSFTGRSIGVLGPNASGKTNLLRFIGYAFLGVFVDTTNDKIASYINYDPDVKSAKVEIHFRAHGQQGVISRELKKKGAATRSLTWRGEVYTEEKEVQRVLKSEIFMADPKAIMDACFIPQGEISRLLFGPLAEREELFMRLMLLSPVEKAAEEIGAQLKMVREGVRVHLPEMLAKAQTSVMEAAGASHHARLELQNLGGIAELEASVNAYQRVLNEAISVKGQMAVLQDTNTTVIQAQQSIALLLNAPLRTLPGTQYAALAAVDEAWTSVRQTNLAMQSALSKNRQGLNVLDLEAHVASAHDASQSFLRQLGYTSFELWDASIVEHRQILQQWSDVETRAKTILTDVNNYEKLKRELDALKPADPTWLEQCEVLQQEIDQLSASHVTTLSESASCASMVSMLEVVAQHKHTQGQCPVCRSAVTSATDVDALLAEWRGKLRDLQQRTVTISEQLAAKKVAHAQLSASFNAAVSAYERQSMTYNLSLGMLQDKYKADELLQPSSFYEAQLNSARSSLADCERALSVVTLQGTYDNEKKRLSDTSATAVSNYNSAKHLYLTQYGELPQQRDKIEAELNNLDADYARFAAQEAELQGLSTELHKRQSALDAAKAAWTKHATALNERKEALQHTLQVAGLAELSADDPVAAERSVAAPLQSTKDRTYAWHQMNATLTERTAHLRNMQNALVELEKEEDLNKQRIATCEILEEAKTLLSRKQLPMTYVQMCFDDIVENVNRAFNFLQSTITVQPHPDEPLTFIFQDDSDPEARDIWQHQNKMSGAQRSLLGVAYVCAMQKIVFPQFGFLVLDEPSSHMDDRNAMGLNNLIANISEMMENDDFQLWVCDHHTGIVALDDVIQLGRSK